jgi:hypothetical protein
MVVTRSIVNDLSASGAARATIQGTPLKEEVNSADEALALIRRIARRVGFLKIPTEQGS